MRGRRRTESGKERARVGEQSGSGATAASAAPPGAREGFRGPPSTSPHDQPVPPPTQPSLGLSRVSVLCSFPGTCSRSAGSLPLPDSYRPSDAEPLEKEMQVSRDGTFFFLFFCLPLSTYSLLHWNELQVFLWGNVSFSPWVRTGRATVKILLASSQGWACGPGRPAGRLSCGLQLEPSENRVTKTQLELTCAWWHQGPGTSFGPPPEPRGFPPPHLVLQSCSQFCSHSRPLP